MIKSLKKGYILNVQITKKELLIVVFVITVFIVILIIIFLFIIPWFFYIFSICIKERKVFIFIILLSIFNNWYFLLWILCNINVFNIVFCSVWVIP